MDKFLTLEEWALNEAKIDKDIEKLIELLDDAKSKENLDGEFERWGTEIVYSSKKLGDVKVLKIIKGNKRKLAWTTMPGHAEENEFGADDLEDIVKEIINNIK